MTSDINLPLHAFSVDIPTVDAWMKANAGSYYCGISVDYDLSVHFTEDPGGTITASVEGYWMGLTSSSPEATNFTANISINAIKAQVAKAKAFADDLVNHFDAENLILGINADDMVDTVVTVMQPVMNALASGSITAAISRAKAIPVGSYDSKYITAARLLSYVNQFEAYLGITLSTSL